MSRHQKIANSSSQPLGAEAAETPREKRGRTTASQTPVSIHADGIELPEALHDYVHKKLGDKLGGFALQIERVAIRFSDINGPRGGTDSECRVQVVLARRPQVVVTERAKDPRKAFDAANQAAGRAVKRDLERAGFSRGLRVKREGSARGSPEVSPPVELEVAPEPSSRNVRKRTPRKAAALELSTGKPSRMSTRKGANGVRSGLGLQRRAQVEAHAPKSVAAAARAKRK